MAVLVDAPREAISAILERHPDLSALFQHHWMHLFALDDRGRMAWRYAGDLGWQPMSATQTSAATPEIAMA
jgi:uncharacterized protein YbcC (UPF0753/DUF2309 family)